VVGRELRTMCPLGEDHQGRDWGGTTEPGGEDSRGSMTIDSRRLRPTTTVYMAWSWIKVSPQGDLLLMNIILTV